MRGGQLNALIVEAIGLDVGEAVALLLTGDEEAQSEMVPIRCFVGDFAVQDGVMRAEALVLDTTDSTITGKGQIDLGAETMSLELLAHPKDASVADREHAGAHRRVFQGARDRLSPEELQEKSLAALALGVIMPVLGAVLPFVEQGETKDSELRAPDRSRLGQRGARLALAGRRVTGLDGSGARAAHVAAAAARFRGGRAAPRLWCTQGRLL